MVRLLGVGTLAALVAGFGFGAGASARTVPPQDDQASVRFELTVEKPERVCAGSDIAIKVEVVRHTVRPHAPELANSPLNQPMASVVVESRINDPAVLSTDNPTEITGLTGKEPPAAMFHFHALKAGISNVDFTAHLAAMTETDPDLWPRLVPDQTKTRTVTVVNCKFELSVLSAGNGLAGLIFKAEIEFGDDGRVTKSVFVTWASAIKVTSPCGTADLAVQNSTADVTAKLDQDGTVEIDLDYQTVPGTVTGTCFGITRSTPLPSEPSTLHIEVGFRGGTGTITQTLTGISSGTLPAHYAVRPIEASGS